MWSICNLPHQLFNASIYLSSIHLTIYPTIYIEYNRIEVFIYLSIYLSEVSRIKVSIYLPLSMYLHASDTSHPIPRTLILFLPPYCTHLFIYLSTYFLFIYPFINLLLLLLLLSLIIYLSKYKYLPIYLHKSIYLHASDASHSLLTSILRLPFQRRKWGGALGVLAPSCNSHFS